MSDNFLQSGAAWLGGQLKEHAARTITIIQGNDTLEDIVATVASHDYTVIDQEGFPTQFTSFDWLLVSADLEGVVLRTGAVIEEVLNGVTSRYEAMPVGDMPSVQAKDTSGIMTVVHTKKIA